MECPKCSGVLKVTRTYRAGPAGKTSSARCEGCGKVWTLVTVIECEASGYGKGAYAHANRLRRKESA